MKYRKSVVVEAYQIPQPGDQLTSATPKWLIDALIDRTVIVQNSGGVVLRIYEGVRCDSTSGAVGDYIVRSHTGQLSVVKQDVFEVEDWILDEAAGP